MSTPERSEDRTTTDRTSHRDSLEKLDEALRNLEATMVYAILGRAPERVLRELADAHDQVTSAYNVLEEGLLVKP